MPVQFEKCPSGIEEIPLLFDSPHSGRVYPDDFDTKLEIDFLRTAEDVFVDELFAGAPDVGASLITATFPRVYLDANRAEDDIDPIAIADVWPGPLNTTGKSNRGKGLVWETMHGMIPIYERKLRSEEIAQRIESYWRPYHTAVSDEMDRLRALFGQVYHVNCHSMRGEGKLFDTKEDVERSDFVISDLDRTSCDPAFTDFIANHLKARGYDVSINYPFKGAELISAYSEPADHRHSVQIEINRNLYLEKLPDEKRLDYSDFCVEIQRLVEAIAGYVKASV
ncbi:MAG: N-formylglutamate amidohydrolase [Rhodospirillales bacterium]|jgi:N-formylglutamate deformylase|nr:N-formylglutamate amidohydrolase [Rhodospirillales bacterium]